MLQHLNLICVLNNTTLDYIVLVVHTHTALCTDYNITGRSFPLIIFFSISDVFIDQPAEVVASAGFRNPYDFQINNVCVCVCVGQRGVLTGVLTVVFHSFLCSSELGIDRPHDLNEKRE